MVRTSLRFVMFRVSSYRKLVNFNWVSTTLKIVITCTCNFVNNVDLRYTRFTSYFCTCCNCSGFSFRISPLPMTRVVFYVTHPKCCLINNVFLYNYLNFCIIIFIRFYFGSLFYLNFYSFRSNSIQF